MARRPHPWQDEGVRKPSGRALGRFRLGNLERRKRARKEPGAPRDEKKAKAVKSKPDSRNARLRTGLARLDTLGLSADKASIGELERVLHSDSTTDLAVVSRLGEIPLEESVACLRRIEALASHDKELRREVRRALYRLARRGVAGASAESEGSAPPPRSIFTEPELEGYLSLMDSLGDRLLWIIKPRAGGGLLKLSAVVNEPGGLKEAVLAELNRKQLRALRTDLAERHGFRLVEVSWRYCDWIASEGYERVKSRGVIAEAAAAFPQLRMQLLRVSASPQPSPVEEDSALTPDPANLQASGSLFTEKEFEHWFLPEAILAPYLRRVREMRESPIVLDRFQQMSRVSEIANSALEELFSGDGAYSWQRKLDEMAYYFWKTGRREPALRARAAAHALSESPSGGRGIPFFEELTRRSLGLFFEQEAEKERAQQESSLIHTPDQVRQQRDSSPHATPHPRFKSG